MELGLCMNCTILFVAKLMLGLVKERYCRAPMTWKNSMISTGGDPFASYSLTLVNSGVATVFAPYRWCVRKRPP